MAKVSLFISKKEVLGATSRLGLGEVEAGSSELSSGLQCGWPGSYHWSHHLLLSAPAGNWNEKLIPGNLTWAMDALIGVLTVRWNICSHQTLPCHVPGKRSMVPPLEDVRVKWECHLHIYSRRELLWIMCSVYSDSPEEGTSWSGGALQTRWHVNKDKSFISHKISFDATFKDWAGLDQGFDFWEEKSREVVFQMEKNM